MGRITFRQFPPDRPKVERLIGAGAVASEHHAAILEVVCPDCSAPIGQECDGCAVGSFMAHQSRIDVSIAMARVRRTTRRPAQVFPTSISMHASLPDNPLIGDAYVAADGSLTVFTPNGWVSVPASNLV